ncbi:MAG: T9SS type A sorting domain-containing protein, partial [Chlorobi bacterium]|nr:T9SS type A sorting domain-containing protein [Chlorobiota bacterium]
VPMADLLSYRDGYSPQGTGDIDKHIKPYDDPSHPSLVLFAHDGDNSWGGGDSYYYEAVPNFVAAATKDGMVPTTIQQFLHDHPVPKNDVVHVEDGSWVNAANDWGSPQFINWLWPLYNPSTYEFDPNAWNEDARNWAVITAIDNYVCMAEDLSGKVNISKVVYSDASSSNAEKAWAFYLPALTSGYMYYGTAQDMEVKQTIAGNNAIGFAEKVIKAHAGTDKTPPSVFIPQRFPYNPGGKEFGPVYGYKVHISKKDFSVWTYGYDVSGIRTAMLKYRLDKDGVNPLTDNDNDTYAGGPGVGSWKEITMTRKMMDSTYNAGNPDIDFFVLPKAIASLYYAKITGLSDTLVDYYVAMTDTHGNTFKTPIQHVYVGNAQGSGGGGGANPKVYWKPENPSSNDTITVYSKDAVKGSLLHWGVTVDGKSWTLPIAGYRPSGTVEAGSQAVETPFSDKDSDGVFTSRIGPFNNAGQVVQQVNFVIKIDANNWDNNNGQNYGITINNNPDDHPVGADGSVSALVEKTYVFKAGDFYFQGSAGSGFAGIIIMSLPAKGILKYNSRPVTDSTDYTDVSLLTFTPDSSETGSPYTSFRYKVKDTKGRYSDKSYTMTINVFDKNPLGADGTVNTRVNESYTFSDSDFGFSGMDGAVLAGIRITYLPNAGNLEYDGKTVALNVTYPDRQLLQFTPGSGQTGSPYTRFGFKVVDSKGRISDDAYVMTVNVLENYPAGVSWYPKQPSRDDKITFVVSQDRTMDTYGGNLHWGVNKVNGKWTLPIQAYWPGGTVGFGDGHAVETPFTKVDSTTWKVELGPFDNAGQSIYSLHFVLHYGNNTWNNNNSNDWEIQLYFLGVKNRTQGQTKISIYPNPVRSHAVIDIKSGEKARFHIYILNTAGKVIKSKYVGSAGRIVFYNHLIPGIYIVKFVDESSGQVYTKKLVAF